MHKKVLRAGLILVAVATPVLVYAEDVPADSSAEAATPTEQSQPQSSPLQSASTGGQGPADPQTGSLLQPTTASSSPLQSASASGGGITQSPMQNLQQTGSAEQVKLLIQGETEGGPSVPEESSNFDWLGYLVLVCALASAGTAVAVWLQRREP